MKKNLIYLAILLVGALASCSNNSNEIGQIVPFYQILGVEYDATHNETHAGANFKRNDIEGTNLKLSSGAVLINGIEPLFETSGVYYYKESFKGLQDVTFILSRSQDHVFVNKTSLIDATSIGIPETFTSIDKHETTVLAWEGAPIAKNEYVIARLECNGETYKFYNRSVGEKSIAIDIDEDVTAKDAKLYLGRVSSNPLQQNNNNAGGRINVMYTVSKQVTIR